MLAGIGSIELDELVGTLAPEMGLRDEDHQLLGSGDRRLREAGGGKRSDDSGIGDMVALPELKVGARRGKRS